MRTRMGRSLSEVTPAVIQSLPLPGSFFNESLDRHFEVFSRDGKLYQSEFATTPEGAEIFRSTQPIQWIIGAGANGFGGVVRRGDYLFEAPLSHFTSTGKWAPSPGYESADIGFSRPLLAGCISCHSGRPNPADQNTGKFKAVPFSQVAIGCENCHGPGEAHVKAMTSGKASTPGPQIVNPGRLSAQLENDICMSCHEAGDSRVPRPGKTYQDFRPGTPLDNTLSILMVPLQRGAPDNRDHVQHYFEMSMSKCFRSTGGQLRCATCHDPHLEPSSEEAPAYFNAKCMECHASRPCTFPEPPRQKTAPADNCIGCHMPKRDAPETAHTSLTNHRILIRPGEPWPEEAFQQTTPELPDLIHLNAVPGRPDHLPALTLLEAYREIAEQKPAYAAAYQKKLSELEETDPGNAVVQQALGRRDLDQGDPQKAVVHLERAVELDAQSAMAFLYLSEALSRLGRLDQAIAASRKAVSLDAYNRLMQMALICRLIDAKQYSQAVAAMNRYMELFPEDEFMRKMLDLAKQ